MAEINVGFDNKSPTATDRKYLKDGISVFADVAEACSMTNEAYRSLGLTVLIGEVEYWWKNGPLDSDLIRKTAPRDEYTLTTNGSFVLKAGDLLHTIVVISTANFAGLKFGTTSGGEEIWNATVVTNTPFIIESKIYADANKTIYVTGVTAQVKLIIFKN